MREWFTPTEILRHNRGELPDTMRSFNRFVVEEGWRENPELARTSKRRGGGYEYHVSALPPTLKTRLLTQSVSDEVPEQRRLTNRWTRFEGLSAKQKDQCRKRLVILDLVEELTRSGVNETRAIKQISNSHGISASTIFNWKMRVKGLSRENWLAGLATNYRGSCKANAEIHPDAWAALKSDFLRPEKPSFSSVYRRVVAVAKDQGWGVIPNERTLRRRFDKEVPASVLKLLREGAEAVKEIYPAQRRTRSHFHAMQAVNMDGHRLDVFVKMNDGSIGRLYLIAIQDLYSNKFVGWRIANSENKETVRLVIGDMVEKFGIPEKIFLDNGRAFASKWITGGMKTRYRFKIRDEEPQGLLTTLGVQVIWTTPYSGQSKPIERAFKDLCETIAKHPLCHGAYTGNSPDNKPANYGKHAIDEAEFREHVDRQIRLHNAQDDRNIQSVKGMSFDDAFAQSMALPSTVVRWPTRSQKSLWLLAADQVKAKRGNGEIQLFGNRYWDPALSGFAAKPVTVRFDPDDLSGSVRVYNVQDQFICEAKRITDTGFDNVDEARVHASNLNRFRKLTREQAKLHAELSADELARIYSSNIPEEKQPVRPAIPRITVAAGTSVEQEEMPEWDETSEANFSEGLRLVSGGDY